MATQTTNIFNALNDIPQSMQLRLMVLALSGNSPVDSAFTAEADRLGLTEKGRERKEREERERFAERFEEIRKETVRLQERLNLLEQATAEALRENEEHLQNAREELHRIRERAYEITMPDGTVTKVYPDGDKVRTDAGAEVSGDILKASDIPKGAPTWAERARAIELRDALSAEQQAILAYRNKIEQARDRAANGNLAADELNSLRLSTDAAMPESVRKHMEASGQPIETAPSLQTKEPGILGKPFAKATAASTAVPELNNEDFEATLPHPAASAPAPR